MDPSLTTYLLIYYIVNNNISSNLYFFKILFMKYLLKYQYANVFFLKYIFVMERSIECSLHDKIRQNQRSPRSEKNKRSRCIAI